MQTFGTLNCWQTAALVVIAITAWWLALFWGDDLHVAANLSYAGHNASLNEYNDINDNIMNNWLYNKVAY